MQGWVTEMAAYVKSLDPNHLLTVGEEGFYTSTVNQTYCNPSSSARECSKCMHSIFGQSYNTALRCCSIRFMMLLPLSYT